MKKLLTLILCLIPISAEAFYYGGTNLNSFGEPYPSFDEIEPSQPFSKDDDFANQQYRDEVEEYIRQAEEYIENGNNDIKRIIDKQKEAKSKAEQAIDEYNNWVRYR